jgi:hypothetical protein
LRCDRNLAGKKESKNCRPNEPNLRDDEFGCVAFGAAKELPLFPKIGDLDDTLPPQGFSFASLILDRFETGRILLDGEKDSGFRAHLCTPVFVCNDMLFLGVYPQRKGRGQESWSGNGALI